MSAGTQPPDPLAEQKAQHEFAKDKHRHSMEYWTGPGLTLSVLGTIVFVMLAGLGFLGYSTDPESKKLAVQITVPIITALLGLLGGRQIPKVS